MSRSTALAFQSLNTSLVQQIRQGTLGLYKSLLKASKPFQQSSAMQNFIRKEFKANKYNTSQTKVTQLLMDAEKTLDYLEKGSKGDRETLAKINTYIEKFIPKKKVQQQQPKEVKKKKKKAVKEVKRKPYQVAITTRQSSGYEFKRVRGWVQPVQTSMMLKNRVKAMQHNRDRFNELRLQQEMIQGERLFLSQLGCLPKDELKGFDENIGQAIVIVLDRARRKQQIIQDTTIEE